MHVQLNQGCGRCNPSEGSYRLFWFVKCKNDTYCMIFELMCFSAFYYQYI